MYESKRDSHSSLLLHSLAVYHLSFEMAEEEHLPTAPGPAGSRHDGPLLALGCWGSARAEESATSLLTMAQTTSPWRGEFKISFSVIRENMVVCRHDRGK